MHFPPRCIFSSRLSQSQSSRALTGLRGHKSTKSELDYKYVSTQNAPEPLNGYAVAMDTHYIMKSTAGEPIRCHPEQLVIGSCKSALSEEMDTDLLSVLKVLSPDGVEAALPGGAPSLRSGLQIDPRPPGPGHDPDRVMNLLWHRAAVSWESVQKTTNWKRVAQPEGPSTLNTGKQNKSRRFVVGG